MEQGSSEPAWHRPCAGKTGRLGGYLAARLCVHSGACESLGSFVLWFLFCKWWNKKVLVLLSGVERGEDGEDSELCRHPRSLTPVLLGVLALSEIGSRSQV